MAGEHWLGRRSRSGPSTFPRRPTCWPGNCVNASLNGSFRRRRPSARTGTGQAGQMSRATVAEALRILEVQNLVRVKAGRAGGPSCSARVRRRWPNHRQHADPGAGRSSWRI